MNKLLRLLVISFLFISSINAQPRYNAALLDTLKTISTGNTISNYFAGLYHNSVEISNLHVALLTPHTQRFIFDFEKNFGRFFFIAHEQHTDNSIISTHWKGYYNFSNLNKLQYQFIGMNAHINGDMWQALVLCCSYDTLNRYKKELIGFQKAFNVFFDSVYNETKQYKRVRLLHTLSLGIDRIYGRKMVFHWRKRQVKLALLYYKNPERFANKWRRLQKRMVMLNNFAYKMLK